VLERTGLKTLVIENDEYIRGDLVEQFGLFSSFVDQARNFDEAKRKLESRRYDVVSIDLNLTNDDEVLRHDGLTILPLAKRNGSRCYVLSSYTDKETIKKATGIDSEVRYIKKDKLFGSNGIDPIIFKEFIGNSLERISKNSLEVLFKEKFVTNNELLRRNIEEIIETADDPKQKIMILGPTGVGKSFFAQIIHEIVEGQANKNFVKVNLSAQPEKLVESILFGSKKGSYSGSIRDEMGLFEKANGGTLFLDEIGTVSIELQTKLLTVLDPDDDGFYEFRRVGDDILRKSKFRLMTGTCDDLSTLFQEGRLRQDFYYRVDPAVTLSIPGLCERKEDVPFLVDYFLEECPRAITIKDDAMEALVNYQWPGNIRQLKEVIKKLSSGKQGNIGKYNLPLYIINNENPLAAKDAERLFTKAIRSYVSKNGLNKTVKLIELAAFKDAMMQTDGKISKACDYLGISRDKGYTLKNGLSKDEGGDHV